MTRRTLLLAPLLQTAFAQRAEMRWGDTSRLGRPFAKDPAVIRFGGRYLLYYSLPAYGDNRPNDGWGVGIAESRNLVDWEKKAEFLAGDGVESKGVAAPCARVIEGRVHLFYQTYGNGASDSICHAVSDDGLRFRRDPANPVFHASGDWNCGRAIDAEVVRFRNRWFLYAATRDPRMKIQMISGAVSDKAFAPRDWQPFRQAPVLKPELAWEKDCIEAPAAVVRGDSIYLFYAGAYNNAPQQIGCAWSNDGIHFERLFKEPLLPAGAPGSWNSSESGHPGTFVDDDGQTYLFFQGNPDKGRTWLLSFVKIGWKKDEWGEKPYLIA